MTPYNIRQITTNKKALLDLLLLGDEQESMIDRYLDRGEMFALSNNDQRAIAVAVVTTEDRGVIELKNLAVNPAFQRRGYGRKMVDFICQHFRHRAHTILVGTGESQQTISFYESCGFSYSHRVADFFTFNYDHPIFGEGKLLRDMIYLKKRL